MVNCRTEKRIDVPRCYKCWAYDHKIKDCKGPNKRALCYNCGGENHSTKEFANESSCVLCEGKQHGMGSTKCLVFRHVLDNARRKEGGPAIKT